MELQFRSKPSGDTLLLVDCQSKTRCKLLRVSPVDAGTLWAFLESADCDLWRPGESPVPHAFLDSFGQMLAMKYRPDSLLHVECDPEQWGEVLVGYSCEHHPSQQGQGVPWPWQEGREGK